MPVLPDTVSYIYPTRDPGDVLLFSLHPDQMSESFASHGGSSSHPSLAHHINQRTGRKSPTFKYSVLIDDVEFGGAFYVEDAYDWVQRNMGPEAVLSGSNGSQVFIFKGIGTPRMVVLDTMDVEMLVLHPGGGPRRMRLGFSGEYFFPTVIDAGLFRKKRGTKRRDRTQDAEQDARAEGVLGPDIDERSKGEIRRAYLGGNTLPAVPPLSVLRRTPPAPGTSVVEREEARAPALRNLRYGPNYIPGRGNNPGPSFAERLGRWLKTPLF